jgi:hypothetical protein
MTVSAGAGLAAPFMLGIEVDCFGGCGCAAAAAVAAAAAAAVAAAAAASASIALDVERYEARRLRRSSDEWG